MGGSCTRACRFCAVSKSPPAPLDPAEPEKVARAVSDLGLGYVVITSVTRDDLADGGAGHFVQVMQRVREINPGVPVEVLTPDFEGDRKAIDLVAAAGPEVFNHNLETVARLYPGVRPQARYHRSLELLDRVSASGLLAKSGLMVGLGETREEIKSALADLKRAGCSIVTIGQYLPPSALHHPVARYWEPEEFEECRAYGQEVLQIRAVVAGPLVRSSYRARQTYQAVKQ
jgi:lipoic acid synthetase